MNGSILTHEKSLTIALNGPNFAHQEKCRSLWMGPFLPTKKTVNDCEWAHSLMRKVADSSEWAQSRSSGKVSMNLNGPILTHEKVADSTEWAHSCQWKKLSMTVNGPILTCVRKVADSFEWAHSYSWEKLPIALNGPITAHEENCRWLWMGPF